MAQAQFGDRDRSWPASRDPGQYVRLEVETRGLRMQAGFFGWASDLGKPSYVRQLVA